MRTIAWDYGRLRVLWEDAKGHSVGELSAEEEKVRLRGLLQSECEHYCEKARKKRDGWFGQVFDFEEGKIGGEAVAALEAKLRNYRGKRLHAKTWWERFCLWDVFGVYGRLEKRLERYGRDLTLYREMRVHRDELGMESIQADDGKYLKAVEQVGVCYEKLTQKASKIVAWIRRVMMLGLLGNWVEQKKAEVASLVHPSALRGERSGNADEMPLSLRQGLEGIKRERLPNWKGRLRSLERDKTLDEKYEEVVREADEAYIKVVLSADEGYTKEALGKAMMYYRRNIVNILKAVKDVEAKLTYAESFRQQWWAEWDRMKEAAGMKERKGVIAAHWELLERWIEMTEKRYPDTEHRPRAIWMHMDEERGKELLEYYQHFNRYCEEAEWEQIAQSYEVIERRLKGYVEEGQWQYEVMVKAQKKMQRFHILSYTELNDGSIDDLYIKAQKEVRASFGEELLRSEKGKRLYEIYEQDLTLRKEQAKDELKWVREKYSEELKLGDISNVVGGEIERLERKDRLKPGEAALKRSARILASRGVSLLLLQYGQYLFYKEAEALKGLERELWKRLVMKLPEIRGAGRVIKKNIALLERSWHTDILEKGLSEGEGFSKEEKAALGEIFNWVREVLRIWNKLLSKKKAERESVRNKGDEGAAGEGVTHEVLETGGTLVLREEDKWVGFCGAGEQEEPYVQIWDMLRHYPEDFARGYEDIKVAIIQEVRRGPLLGHSMELTQAGLEVAEQRAKTAEQSNRVLQQRIKELEQQVAGTKPQSDGVVNPNPTAEFSNEANARSRSNSNPGRVAQALFSRNSADEERSDVGVVEERETEQLLQENRP